MLASFNQIAQTMQIPLAYAEDIIGIGGANIAYIRRTSGAILTVQESRGLPDEITVEIKGTSSQVQAAQQLIQVAFSFLCFSWQCMLWKFLFGIIFGNVNEEVVNIKIFESSTISNEFHFENQMICSFS